MNYWQWIVSHKTQLEEMAGGVYIGINVLNGLLPHSNKFLRRAIDVMSWFTNKDSPGTMKPAFKRSRKPKVEVTTAEEKK